MSSPREVRSRLRLLQTRFDVSRSLVRDFVRANVDYGMTVVDAGAHSGQRSVEYSRIVGARGRVYVYEPLPSVASWIADNCSPRQNIEISSSALWSSEGTMDLFEPVDQPWRATLVSERVADHSCRVWPVSTLVLARHATDEVAFINLDAEGSEVEILEGGLSLLKEQRPLVAAKFDQRAAMSEVAAPRLLALLQSAQYSVFDVSGCEFSEADVEAASRWDALDQLICIPRERAQAIDYLAVRAVGYLSRWD